MPIEIQGLAPLLQVFDMPTSVAFYRDVLGFEIVLPKSGSDDVDWALLRLNNSELMLNTAFEKPNRPPAPDPARIAAHADAAIYFSCPDVDGAYQHLCAKGLQVQPPRIAPYGMKQLYVLDPDGYELCFQWPASPGA
jgi:glyoxylase I family protein